MIVSQCPSSPISGPDRAALPQAGAAMPRARVTLRVGSLEDGDTSLDHEATWLLGHTEQITFGELWAGNGDLYVEATLHVPCRFLARTEPGAECRLYGYRGAAPRARAAREQPRRLGGQRFRVVDREADGDEIPARRPPRQPAPFRSWPATNPCADAPCRTADNRRAAACCRDLQVEIMCTRRSGGWRPWCAPEGRRISVRSSGKATSRSMSEMISACGYLGDDGVACSLHGRARAEGRPAKPDLCTEWPPKNRGLHPGCVFGPRRRRRRPAAG